jgi:hypothetical protein
LEQILGLRGLLLYKKYFKNFNQIKIKN